MVTNYIMWISGVVDPTAVRVKKVGPVAVGTVKEAMGISGVVGHVAVM